MDKYLADTTVLVDHLRGKKRSIAFLIEKSPCISQVSVAELIQGSRNKNQLAMAEKAVEDLKVIPISEILSNQGIRFMQRFSLSHGLQFLDALVAATAIEEKLILVTSNTKHFSFIKSLKLLDWSKSELTNAR